MHGNRTIAKELIGIAKELMQDCPAYCVDLDGSRKCFSRYEDAMEYVVKCMSQYIDRGILLKASVSFEDETTVVNLASSKPKKLFDFNVDCRTWCFPKYDNYIIVDGRTFETNIYREEDGSYTLQCFDEDEVVLCQSIDDKYI